MDNGKHTVGLRERSAPLEIGGDEFRRIGHQLVDDIAGFLDGIKQRPVTKAASPSALRKLLGPDRLPAEGTPAAELVKEASSLLFDHSLLNGHPRFMGYITSSAAPIGALADLLASAVNPNVGAYILSPVASEIERQTIRWIADLVDYPQTCGGLLVTGGNMANFVGFLAAIRAKRFRNSDEPDRTGSSGGPLAYASKGTHTWIDKAADLFGLGAGAIRWIETDARQQMDVMALEQQIVKDKDAGLQPFIVVGTAGTVSTGAIDPLPEIASICKKYDLWFHVDGAYGAPAAVLRDAYPALAGLHEADSIALDPHKWLYSPLEAGCALVRDPNHQLATFSHHPSYYNFNGSEEDPPINYHEYGLQNSRGFRALKVWLALRQVGFQGYAQMIREDIALAEALFAAVGRHPQLEAVTHSLSITTFRFIPADLKREAPGASEYLNRLNEEILNRMQNGGEAFISNALLNDRYLLRACIVNFRTSLADVEALPEITVRIGNKVDSEMRPSSLKNP